MFIGDAIKAKVGTELHVTVRSISFDGILSAHVEIDLHTPSALTSDASKTGG